MRGNGEKKSQGRSSGPCFPATTILWQSRQCICGVRTPTVVPDRNPFTTTSSATAPRRVHGLRLQAFAVTVLDSSHARHVPSTSAISPRASRPSLHVSPARSKPADALAASAAQKEVTACYTLICSTNHASSRSYAGLVSGLKPEASPRPSYPPSAPTFSTLLCHTGCGAIPRSKRRARAH